MKIVTKGQFNHSQLSSQKTGEVYSLSAVVSQLLGSKQLFIHHDIIAPGNKSSGSHRHTIIEEVVYVAKGTASVVVDQSEIVAPEGALILFDPKDKETHFVVNRTDKNVETMTFSVSSDFDSVVFDQALETEVQRPSSHFDQDLRDVPDSLGEWTVFVDKLKSQLKDENHSAKKLTLFEHIGMASRTLLRFDEAEFYLKEALKRWGRDFSGIYVRKAIPKDAEAIHYAHMRSIQEICSKDHSLQEIQGWGHRPYREDQRVGSIKNDLVWVVEDGGSVEGYGHLRIFEKDGLKRGHIFGLYLTPKIVGKSFGKAVVDLMMEEINAAKVRKVTLQATITAQSFYHKVGFVDDGPQMTVEIGGTPVRCYPMKMEFNYV